MPRSPGQSLLNKDVPDGTELTIRIERPPSGFYKWIVRVTYHRGDRKTPCEVSVLYYPGECLPKSLISKAIANFLATMK